MGARKKVKYKTLKVFYCSFILGLFHCLIQIEFYLYSTKLQQQSSQGLRASIWPQWEGKTAF